MTRIYAARPPLLGAILVLLAACETKSPPRSTARPRPQCIRVRPVRLIVAPSTLATAKTPEQLMVPTPIIERISKTGHNRLEYRVSICSETRSVEHPTGFEDLDRFLDARILDLGLALPSSGCTTATLLLVNLDRACDPPSD